MAFYNILFWINNLTKSQNKIKIFFFQAVINFKWNIQANFLIIVKFVYNNDKNIKTSYILYKLNYNHYFEIFYKKILIFYLNLILLKKCYYKF